MISISPAFTFSSLIPSHKWVRSYGSIDESRSTFYKVVSYLSLRLIDDSFTILLKHSLSKEKHTESVKARIVAALGALYKRASSPNDSPGL